MIDNTSISQSSLTETRSIEKDPEVNMPSDIAWSCIRGLPIRSRMADNISTLSCICPPSYYGDRCQYQNQRVSLTIQFRASSDWRSNFLFLITLIDNERNIQSHYHIECIPMRDCRNKYNIYLLYSTRPKNLSKTYSIQIDMFNQNAMDYRASWIFPLQFPFLPVHRLAVLLNLPFSNVIFAQGKCSSSCIHGQCFHYINDQNSTFCLCEAGWSGVQCHIEHKCDYEPCLNGGQCVPVDVRYTYAQILKTICICPEEYVGDRCEHKQTQTQIDISFHSSMSIPSFLLVHFIAVRNRDRQEHNRTSIAKKIQFDQNSLTPTLQLGLILL